MTSRSLTKLKNIGKCVAARLHEIGINSEEELKTIGSVKAYKYLCEKDPKKHLPVCYYLYSLEGAIQNKHWDDFSKQEKANLRIEAGITGD